MRGVAKMLRKYTIESHQRDEMIEVTDVVQAFVNEQQIQEGTVLVYCPHTTAGITINENADPDVKSDMLRRFDEMYPWKVAKDLHAEGNTAAHMKASTVGSSQTIIVSDGKLLLGTWQGIYFCEFDGPRQRNFYIKAC